MTKHWLAGQKDQTQQKVRKVERGESKRYGRLKNNRSDTAGSQTDASKSQVVAISSGNKEANTKSISIAGQHN